MLQNIFKLYKLLNYTQKKYLWILIFLMTLSSFLEIASMLSILYLVNFVSSSYQDPKNSIDFYIYQISDYLSIDVVYFIGFVAVGLLILHNLISIVNHFLNSYLNSKIVSQISEDLTQYYINRNYLDHVADQSSRLMNNINSLCFRINNEILEPLVNLISRLIFVIPVVIGVFIYNFKISLWGVLIFAITYFLVFYNLKKIVQKNGERYTFNSKNKFEFVNTIFGLFSEIKLSNLSGYFLNIFKKLNYEHIKINYINSLTKNSPKNIIELIAFTVIIFLIIFSYSKDGFDFIIFAQTLAVFIICAYKLLPSFQQIYLHLMTIKSGIHSFTSLEQDMLKALNFRKNKLNNNTSIGINSLELKEDTIIELKNVSFFYKNTKFPGLTDINLKFNFGEKIAIYGKSGSGKSTLANILTGLIYPEKGAIYINNKKINKYQISSYQSLISLVPQDIYLTNGSIKENIILGDKDKINFDQNKYNTAINFSKLNDLIDIKKDNENFLGETGSQLSGGQKQRIGIARSLYKESKIIVFDESTNSLDNETEINVLRSLLTIGNEKLVFMITHNSNLLEKFDKIIFLENGKLIGFDNFKNLFETNLSFKQLYNIQKNN